MRIAYTQFLTSRPKDEEGENSHDLWEQWERQIVIRPEPGAFEPQKNPPKLDLREKYGKRGLQVIVKLANVELTPDKPEYEGGTWHVEGQLVSFLLFLLQEGIFKIYLY